MRNLFERDVLEAEQRELRNQATRNRRGGRGRATNRLAAIARRRNLFMQGKEEWPAPTSGGVAMEIVERRPNGVVEYRFVHSTAYQDAQRQFEMCVASMNPQRLQIHTISQHYYNFQKSQSSNIGTLMQVIISSGLCSSSAVRFIQRSQRSCHKGRPVLTFDGQRIASSGWRHGAISEISACVLLGGQPTNGRRWYSAWTRRRIRTV